MSISFAPAPATTIILDCAKCREDALAECLPWCSCVDCTVDAILRGE